MRSRRRSAAPNNRAACSGCERARDPEGLRVIAQRTQGVCNGRGGGIELSLVKEHGAEDLKRDPELAAKAIRARDTHSLFTNDASGREIALSNEERHKHLERQPLAVEVAHFLEPGERRARRGFGRHQPCLA